MTIKKNHIVIQLILIFNVKKLKYQTIIMELIFIALNANIKMEYLYNQNKCRQNV